MYKQNLLLLIYPLFMSIFNSNAQQTTCGSEILLNQAIQDDETFIQEQLDFERSMALRMMRRNQTNTVYKIPLVVHIIHLGEPIGTGSNISDAQVQSAINNLNTAYRGNNGQSIDTQIEFELAKQDEFCNSTTGIVRVDGRTVSGYATDGVTFTGNTTNVRSVKALSSWANDQYYNIWIVSKIEGSNQGGIQGFATIPTGRYLKTDGSVILHNAFGYDPNLNLGFNLKSYTNQNKTTIHELGHGLNLRHTFLGDKGLNGDQAEQCPSEINGCVSYNSTTRRYEYTGDCCADTPRHKRSNRQCSSSVSNDCDANVSLVASIENFMSYSTQNCKTLFTQNQKERMRLALETFRPSLLTSKALALPNDFPRNAPSTPNCIPTTQATGLSAFYSGIKSVKFGIVQNVSSFPSEDSTTGYLDATQQCIRNFEVGANGDPTLTVELFSNNSTRVKAWLDFNNDGEFSESELVLSQTNRNQSNPATVDVPIQGGVELRKLYRLRVICDLVSIQDACSNPTYGQVEDYAVEFAGISSVPVHLVSFSGIEKQEQVQLNWETTFERNHSHFVIERSIDGINFQQIGAIHKRNTVHYQWFDKHPLQGINYYRLLQYDLTGQYEIVGEILAIELEKEDELIISPNPVTQAEDVLLYLNSNQNGEKVNIHLFDVNGQLLFSEQTHATKGQNQFVISTKHLPKGIYLLKVQIHHHIYTEKIINQ